MLLTGTYLTLKEESVGFVWAVHKGTWKIVDYFGSWVGEVSQALQNGEKINIQAEGSVSADADTTTHLCECVSES